MSVQHPQTNKTNTFGWLEMVTYFDSILLPEMERMEGGRICQITQVSNKVVGGVVVECIIVTD